MHITYTQRGLRAPKTHAVLLKAKEQGVGGIFISTGRRQFPWWKHWVEGSGIMMSRLLFRLPFCPDNEQQTLQVRPAIGISMAPCRAPATTQTVSQYHKSVRGQENTEEHKKYRTYSERYKYGYSVLMCLCGNMPWFDFHFGESNMTKKINQEFLAQRTLGQGTATNFWEELKLLG